MCQFEQSNAIKSVTLPSSMMRIELDEEELGQIIVEESLLPNYNSISETLLPPAYSDRRVIEGRNSSNNNNSIVYVPTDHSIMFYESFLATIWNSCCLLFLINATIPSSPTYSAAIEIGLKNWTICLGLLILISSWISILSGLRTLITPQDLELNRVEGEEMSQMRKMGIYFGTGFSMVWMYLVLSWFVVDQVKFVKVDLSILILCCQLGVVEQVYHEYKVSNMKARQESEEESRLYLDDKSNPIFEV